MLKKFYASVGTSGDDLISDFRSTCFRDLRSAEIYFISRISQVKDKALLRKKIQQAFVKLIKKINDDDALFISEKEEVLEKAEKIKKFLLKRLDNSSRQLIVKSSGDAQFSKVSRLTVLPEFKEFLTVDSALLEVGGCQVFENAHGKKALIAVGIAVVKDNSPQDRLRCQRVAEQKALGELAKYQNIGVDVASERFSIIEKKNNNGVKSESLQRVTSSRITMHADAYVDKMMTVGHWHSKDGKLFFLAKGCIIDK